MKIKNREEIDKFIRENYRSFSGYSFMFGEDTFQDTGDKFNTANIRVLVMFLSYGMNRFLSNTFSVLNQIIHKDNYERVFVDYCYFPAEDSHSVFKREGIPFAFGNVSHAPVQDYDFLLVSHSFLSEVFNVVPMFLNSGIPLPYEKRVEDTSIPVIVYGGSASLSGQILCGEVDGGNSLVDFLQIGSADNTLNSLINKAIEFKSPIKENKKDFYHQVLTDDYLRSYFYFPVGYKHIYDNQNFIITEVKKMDSRVPTTVKVNRHIENFTGFNQPILNVSGLNAQSASLMVSSGCSSSCCSFCHPSETLLFTDRGIRDISNLEFSNDIDNPIPIDYTIATMGDDRKAHTFYCLDQKSTVRVKSFKGYEVASTPDTLLMTLRGEECVWTKAKDIQPGDIVVLRKGSNLWGPGDESLSIDDAEFLGRIFGNGVWNKKVSLYCYQSYLNLNRRLLDRIGLEYSEIELGGGSYEFRFQSSDEFRSKYGMDFYVGTYRKLPDPVYIFNKEQISYFLRGLFDSGGAASDRGNVLVFSPYRERLLVIQNLLLNFGIVSRLKKSSKTSKTTGKEKILYSLIVDDTLSMKVFREEIGTSFPVKYERINSSHYQRNLIVSVTPEISEQLEEAGCNSLYLSRFGYTKGFAEKDFVQHFSSSLIDTYLDYNLVFDEVVSVEQEGVKFVYDLTTEDSTGIDAHSYLANGFISHNCSEGHLAGAYREKSLEVLSEEIKETKIHSAADSLKYFAFNSNYYSKLIDLMKEGVSQFRGATFMTQRADVLSDNNSYIDLVKKLNIIPFSIAVEGVGDRIRNKILNKNLSLDQILGAIRNILSLKPIRLKINMIWTGLEDEQDYLDFERELEAIKELKEESQYNSHITFTFTPIVIYPNTPIRWLKRITGIDSWKSVPSLNPIMQLIREKGFNVRVHGGNYRTTIDQFIIDIGRKGTSLLEFMYRTKGLYLKYGLGRVHFKALSEWFNRFNLDISKLFRERSLDEIFPVDDFELTTPYLLEKWKDQYRKKDFQHSICLKTSESSTPYCEDCGYCTTEEQKKKIVCRDLKNESTIGQVEQVINSNNSNIFSRFVLQKNSGFDYVSLNSLSRYIVSLFLREVPSLFNYFSCIENHTTFWASKNHSPDFFGGRMGFDVYWKEALSIDLNSLIDKINSKIVSAKLLYIIDSDISPIQRKSFLTCLAEIKGWSIEGIKDKIMSFDWEFPVALRRKALSLMLNYKDGSSYKDNFLFSSAGGSVYLVSHIPSYFNPYLILSRLLSIRLKEALASINIKVLDQGIPTKEVCSCGGKIHNSYLSPGKNSICPIDKSRIYLYRLSKNLKR